MNITPTTLTYALFTYGVVFVIISLFFFVHCIKLINRVHDMVEGVISLLDRAESRYEEIKHEGTDTD